MSALIGIMEEDFYRNSRSLLQTAEDFDETLLTPSKALWRYKVDHTSAEHGEIEDHEVYEAAHFHFERLEDDVRENIIAPLIECASGRLEVRDDNFEEALSSAQRIYRDVCSIYLALEQALHQLALKFSNRSRPTPQRADKFVVSADLSKYGLISSTKDLDELFAMNQAIQQSIHKSICAAGASLDSTIVEPTGDGAIILFDTAGHALGFARHLVSEAAAISEREIRQPEYRRHYRVGISYGPIKYQQYFHGGSPTLSAHMAGTAIAIAVRIQAEAKDGAVWVQNTIIDIANRERLDFQFEEMVFSVGGKQHEVSLPTIPVRVLKTR